MIALNETDPTAAEIPFFLPLTSDTFTGPGLTGHVFVLGEVQIKLPGSGWVNASVASIVEKGFGRYCVRLSTGQTSTAGTAYIRTVGITGAQPYTGSEDIGQAGGDIPVGVSGRFPFYLPNATDPVNGAPITGHTFLSGEVKVCLPSGVYVNADPTQIFEVGFGTYELLLSPAQTAARGKVFLYALVPGSQRFEGYATVLSPTGTSTSTGGGTIVTTAVSSPIAANASSYVDHVAAALARLPLQFRSIP